MNVAFWLKADSPAMSPLCPLCPQKQTFGLGQIQAPACRRRNGLADTIKVAGIGLIDVPLVNERLKHLTGHLDRHHEAAVLASVAVAALAFGGSGGGCVGHGSGQPRLLALEAP